MIHLLVLALVLTGCEAVIEACTGGWFEFTCKYKTGTYQTIDVKIPRGKFKSTKVNTWEQNENVFLYHDEENKLLRVKVTALKSADSGCYKCKIQGKPTEVELEVKNGGCQEPFRQTVYATDEITITCNYPKNRQGFFFCKENGSDCVDVFPTHRTQWSEGRFSLTEIESGFSVSISDVSLQDGGVYWCGHKSAHGSYRSSLRKIELEVKISEPPPATTPSVHETTGSSTSSVQTTTASTKSQGGSLLLVIVAIVAVVCAAALVLLVVKFKRCEGSKNTTQDEDHSYEEIELRPHRPGSGTARKTLYVTANFPTNVSGSHYSNILFEKSSGEVSGDTYSTVGGSVLCPTYFTVNHPSSFTEKTLYSTVTFSVKSSQEL